MKTIFLIFLFITGTCFYSPIHGLSHSTDEKEKLEKLKGTFRIITQLRTYELPSNLSEIIERNRLKDKDTTLTLGKGVLLVIYSAAAMPTNMQKE
jgi:hypothetical protein